MTWIKDSAIEYKLSQLQITPTYVPDFPIAAIDLYLSQHNQGRHNGLSVMPDHVKEITDVMQENPEIPFPAILLMELGRPATMKSKTTVMVIDGNHRLLAAIGLKQTFIAAYVIPPQPGLISDLLIRTSNVPRGRGQTSESEGINYVQLAKDNYTDIDIAKYTCQTIDQVRTKRVLQQVALRLVDVGFRNPAVFVQAIRMRMDSIVEIQKDQIYGNDPVLKEVAQICLDGDLQANVASILIADVNAIPIVKDQMDFLANYRKTNLIFIARHKAITQKAKASVQTAVASTSQRPTRSAMKVLIDGAIRDLVLMGAKLDFHKGSSRYRQGDRTWQCPTCSSVPSSTRCSTA
jgi:hypothetical protein